MALNTTLLNLLQMLKVEAGDSIVAGTQKDATYKQLLAIKQQLLCSEFSFPYMQDRWDVAAPLGSRYLNLPTQTVTGQAYTLDYSRPLRVTRYWNLLYIPLIYGIPTDLFNIRNSDLLQTLDPIQRWQWRQYSSLTSGPTITQEFEIWPMNATAAVIRFEGQRILSPLVADTDKADIDDLLLVLSCAVEILMRSKQADAPLRLANAKRRLQQLRGGYPEPIEPPAVFGGRSQQYDQCCKRILISGQIPDLNYLLTEDGNEIIP